MWPTATWKVAFTLGNVILYLNLFNSEHTAVEIVWITLACNLYMAFRCFCPTRDGFESVFKHRVRSWTFILNFSLNVTKVNLVYWSRYLIIIYFFIFVLNERLLCYIFILPYLYWPQTKFNIKRQFLCY